MRWKTRLIREGETRIIDKFLILPLTIYSKGFLETRWLCWSRIQQRRDYSQDDGAYWTNIGFVDE